MSAGMRNRCRVCNVAEGEMHEACWNEHCPACDGMRHLSCDCDPSTRSQLRGVPFIVWPNICQRCGLLWPTMFRVPDQVWRHYIEPRARKHMLCLGCWNEIIDLIDSGSFAADYCGGAKG